ncbi:MAG: uroporphyrinogen-III synthase [Chloroflexaceae bacterium]|jgi:uroporphyrinogen-III synthase|nr:uroporphyrinogen-III synthase [Chloroflexaceae bacterium]
MVQLSTLNSQLSTLAGLRVVITRAEGSAEGFAERLRACGAEPIVYPVLAFAPPEDPALLAAAMQRLAAGDYNWLVLTSGQAVKAIADGRRETEDRSHTSGLGLPSPVSGHCRVAAVGSATAAACAELLGVAPAAVPEKFTAEALTAALGTMQNQRVLLPNADIALPTAEERLRAAGALVDRVVAYRTVPASGGTVDMAALLRQGAVDVITFTSPSAARYFVGRIGPTALEDARRCTIACIGPTTAAGTRNAGLEPTLVAEVSTEEGLIAAMERSMRYE